MQVWDTAGQERFRTITQSYYRSAHGAMVAYDITRRNTFESVPHWIREVEQYGAASVVLILIGKQNEMKLFACWAVKFQILVETAEGHSAPAVNCVGDIPLWYSVSHTTHLVPLMLYWFTFSASIYSQSAADGNQVLQLTQQSACYIWQLVAYCDGKEN